MARRAGAPGAKTERAWRHGGPGLRAWRRLGRLQCAGRRLQLFSVRWAPTGFCIDTVYRYFCAEGANWRNSFLKSNSFLLF